MGRMRYPVCILILLFLAAVFTLDASALDPEPWQDQRGNATPVLMGKNLGEANVGQEATGPKSRLLSPMVRWELDLKDSLDRTVEMEMYQSNDVLFGKGRIMADGMEQNVSAIAVAFSSEVALSTVDALSFSASMLAASASAREALGSFEVSLRVFGIVQSIELSFS